MPERGMRARRPAPQGQRAWQGDGCRPEPVRRSPLIQSSGFGGAVDYKTAAASGAACIFNGHFRLL
ncbi:hypothetical protein C6568_04365 [Melaminivora suipulveris]|uniref:Uncharacterized protein n=1 Tax=Melaminivora suipulveris TaxID=2109913 RepID=A0A2R3QAC1_9BURK|nr:hypothetical protein C6568_04365 [Melaminivora suipulveris]